MRFLKINIVLLFLICFTFSGFAQEQRIVAIVPFANDGPVAYDWVARGIEEILYDKLTNLQNLTVFEKITLDRYLQENQIKNSEDLTVKKAFKLGRDTGTEIIIAGKYRVIDGNLFQTFRVISTYTGADIYLQEFRGPLSDIFQIHERALSEILKSLALPLTANDRKMLLARSTNSIKAFEYYCKAYMELKRGASMDAVARFFTLAIEQDPNFWEAQYNLGVIYYNFDRYEEALAQFKKVSQKNPRFYKPYFGMGIIYYLKKDNAEAIRQFNKVLALNPKHDRSLYYLGRVYLRLDSLEKGIDYLMKSLELNPNYAPTYFQLARANMRREWYKTAIQQLKKCIQLNPQNYRAHNLLGESYYRLQRFDDAITEYKKAVELKKDFSTAYFNLGNTYYKKGALEEIVDAYLEILETRYSRDQNSPENLKLVNDIRQLRKNFTGRSADVYNAMIRSYRKALRYEPGFFEAAYNLALTYENIGRVDSAEYFYKQALDVNPNLVRAHMRLGRLYEKEKRFDEALKEFKEVVKIEPSYFADNPRLGEDYRYINIVEDVLQEYLTRYDLNPRDTNTLLVLGRIFSSLGRWKQAEKYYQEIVQIDPRNQQAMQALKSLRTQRKKL